MAGDQKTDPLEIIPIKARDVAEKPLAPEEEAYQRLAARVERVEDDLAVQVKGRDERERDIAVALEQTQATIDKLNELAHRPQLVELVSKYGDLLEANALLERLLDEAHEMNEVLRKVVVTAQEERRFRRPWYRRLLGDKG